MVIWLLSNDSVFTSRIHRELKTRELKMSTVGNSANIFWQESPVGKLERQKLLNQKGCVVWITGLSGSGLSLLRAFIFSSELRFPLLET